MKKSLTKLAGCFCILLVFHFAAVAQNAGTSVTVQGKLLDSDKKPISGATVAEVDDDGRTIKATRTDIDGNFSSGLLTPNTNLVFPISVIKRLSNQLVQELLLIYHLNHPRKIFLKWWCCRSERWITE